MNWVTKIIERLQYSWDVNPCLLKSNDQIRFLSSEGKSNRNIMTIICQHRHSFPAQPSDFTNSVVPLFHSEHHQNLERCKVLNHCGLTLCPQIHINWPYVYSCCVESGLKFKKDHSPPDNHVLLSEEQRNHFLCSICFQRSGYSVYL